MAATKQHVDSSLCPNCKQAITVPKSTRSFICRHCDAIIKVIQKETDVELKVVGKSVEDDPTYQAIESQVTELRAELAEMHKRYEAWMATDIGKIGSRTFLFALVAIPAGLITMIWSASAGAAIAGLGLVVGFVGWFVQRGRKQAKQVVATEMSDTIFKIGAQRDLLQRKAARLKTEI